MAVSAQTADSASQRPTESTVAVDPTLLDFSADRMVDLREENRIVLTGNVVLKFQGVEIRAGQVVYDRSTDQITAEPLVRVGLESGLPNFTRGSETVTGRKMVYDVKTGKGRIWE